MRNSEHRRLLVDDEHEELVPDERLELGQRPLVGGRKRPADFADRRKPALVDHAAREADVDQRPHNGFGETAAGHLGLELADPARDQRLVQLAPRRLARRAGRGGVDAERRLQRRRSVDRVKGLLCEALRALAPGIEPVDDLARHLLLQRQQGVVGTRRASVVANPLGGALDPGEERIPHAEHRGGEAQRVQAAHRLNDRRVRQGAHDRPGVGAVERQVDLGHAGGGLELALVGEVVAAEGADVVERARLAAHHPFAGDEVGVVDRLALRGQHRLVEARREHVDQVDVRGELVVLLPRDARRDEDAEMPDLVVDGVDDGLAVGADLVDVCRRGRGSSRAPAAAG